MLAEDKPSMRSLALLALCASLLIQTSAIPTTSQCFGNYSQPQVSHQQLEAFCGYKTVVHDLLLVSYADILGSNWSPVTIELRKLCAAAAT
jgi:hypothetical protein